jgi:anti-sigma factor RsiW
MDHAEARELLEIAAVEPGGFDRLIAGDTPDASALASHLAGCPDCAEEMERLRRAATIVQGTLRSMPPPDLRDRTLAFVAAVGRDRSTEAAVAGAGGPATPSVSVVPSGHGNSVRSGPPSRRLAGLWAASLAAAVVIAIVATSAWVTGIEDQRTAAQAQQIASLARVATWSLRIDAEADARYVDLQPAANGTEASASLVFSPSSGELVVLANNLPEPPQGMEYRCWMQAAAGAAPVGKMFFGGGVSYWVGDVESVKEATDGTQFGVSLVPIGGAGSADNAVLLGRL